jgi:hypothetical protein
MSALSEIQEGQIGRRGFVSESTQRAAVDLHQVAPLFWAWFHQNQDRKVMKLFGFYTLKIGDLRPVFVMLFGDEAL